MLDQLRRHGTSWVVKLTLTLIIFSFIFFFGYSRISSQYREEHLYVATIEGKGVPRKKFENLYQTSVDRLRENIGGQMPSNMEGFLRQNVMDQLINREVILLFGQKLGLSVSDEEVASFIREDKNLFPDGAFDLTAYEKNFLPNYRQRIGENFEDAVRRDLLVEKTQAFAETLYAPWRKDLETSRPEKPKKPTEEPSEKKTKKTKDEQSPEKQPDPEPVFAISSSQLFFEWIEGFKDKVKVTVFK